MLENSSHISQPEEPKEEKNDQEEEHQKLIQPINESQQEKFFIDYTEKVVDKFFASEKSFDSPDFYTNFVKEIQAGQDYLQNELTFMLKDDEINTKKINQKKEFYLEKLDLIKNFHNNFEYRVDVLNQLYSDKLAYISLLSRNLFEFEKMKKNTAFANKIFEYLAELNKSKELTDAAIPDIFTDPEKILSEGLEYYLAFQQLIINMKHTEHLSNFIENFKKIEVKIKDLITSSIKDCYANSDWEKLQSILRVTDVIKSDLIIDLYVSYITNDVMRLEEYTNGVEKVNFATQNISEELYTLIFKIADDFHESLLKVSEEQFGCEYSKIFILFPESRQKFVISKLVSSCLKKMNNFRNLFLVEENKSDESYVRIVQYLYPKTLVFLEKYQSILEYSKSDLKVSLIQETNIFLRSVEAVYMNKERNLLNSFIESTYKTKIKKVAEIKTLLLMGMHKKNVDLSGAITETLNSLFDLIQSTNFSFLLKQSTTSITRYNMLIQSKEEKEDLTESFCKEIFDSIQNLLVDYCNLSKIIFEQCEKKNYPISEKHFLLLSKITYCTNEFKQIFLNELKDFFKSVKFYDIVEDYVRKCINKVEVATEVLFSELNTYASLEYNEIMKGIKYKEIYKISSSKAEENTEEAKKIIVFLVSIFKCINENWTNVERNKKMLTLLLTKMTADKMKDILKNAKINEKGVSLMKNDFQKISNTFAEYTDETFYSKVYDVFFLSEIFTTSKNELESFCQTLEKDDKYDKDLIRIIQKKRKGLNMEKIIK